MADGSVKFDTEIDSSGMRSGLASLGKVALAGVGTAASAIAALGTAAVKTGIDFESAFAGVKKTVDASDEQLAKLRQDILDMSKEMPTAATEIACIAEAAGQLGIKTEAIADFTRTMADLGVATNMTSEQAATDLARLANITQMPQTEFGRLGSTVVALGNNLATTESEIVSMALRLAGTGKQVGMTEDQILSLAGAASSVGLAAELGGSAFSRVLSMMQLSAEQGGASLKAFADVAGMSASEFKTAFEQDAAGALVAFVEGLGKAEESGKSAIGVIAEMGDVAGLSTLDTVAVRDALLRAAGASNVFAESLEIGSEAWRENTALTKEAEQRYETFESKLGILKNTASSLGIAVYEGIKEPLSEVVSFATDAMNQLDAAFAEGGFDGLISELGNVLGEAVNEIVAFAPTIIEAALGLIENLITTILGSSGQIIDAAIKIGMMLVESIASLAPQLITAAAQIISQLSIGLVEALPTLIETTLSCLTSCVDALIESIPVLIEAVLTVVQSIVDYLPELLPMLLEAVLSIVIAIVDYLPELVELLIAQLPTLIESFISAVLGFIPQLLESVITIVNAIVEALPQIIELICGMLPQIVSSIVSSLLGMIPQLVECGIQLLTSLVQALPEIITAIADAMPMIVESITSTLIDMIPEIVDCGVQLLSSLVAELPTIIVTILAAIGDIIDEIIWAIADCIPMIIEAGIDLLCALVEALPEIIAAIIPAIPTIVASIVEAFVGNAGLIAEAGVNLLVALITNLPHIIVEIVKAVPKIIVALVKGFAGGISSFIDVGKNMLLGIGDGIANAVGSVVQKAKNACRNILNSVKGFFGIHSPSRLFKNVIGKNLMLGLAAGIDDESSAAISAMGKAAKEIADVDIPVSDIKFDDPDKLYAKVSGTVTAQKDEVTASKAAEVNSTASDDDNNESEPKSDAPMYVQNDIYLDGRKTARIITPYVAKELEWEGK